MAYKLLQLRKDTAANWTSNNPTLLSAEMGFETDTKKIKIGDGTTAWNDLDYFAGNGAGADVKVAVDADAVANYLGAANNDGVLRTGTSLNYADGGNFITLDTIQDIRTTATPTLGGLIIANGGTIGQVVGPLLTFNDTNNYLGITGCNIGFGTAAPQNLVHVDGGLIRTDGYTLVAAPGIEGRIATGTKAEPSATTVEHYLIGLYGRGYSTSAWGANNVAAMIFHAGGTFSDSSQPSYITFATTPVNAISRIERVRILPDGGIKMPFIKAGTTQAAAGAAAGELWADTDDANTIKLGT